MFHPLWSLGILLLGVALSAASPVPQEPQNPNEIGQQKPGDERNFEGISSGNDADVKVMFPEQKCKTCSK